MSEIISSYSGFLPPDGDGNAKIKTEFIVEKKHEPKPPPCQETTNEEKKPFKKSRGQNKNRPRPQREALAKKLCPSKVNQRGVCAFGEKCKYIHDVVEYMKIKPDDLGEECIAFRTKGICQYGYACRFAKDHVTFTPEEGYKNVVNEELISSKHPSILNVIPRELQVALRKRKFEFAKTEEALKDLAVIQEKRRKTHNLHQGSNSEPKAKLEVVKPEQNDLNTVQEDACSIPPVQPSTETKPNLSDIKNVVAEVENSNANCNGLKPTHEPVSEVKSNAKNATDIDNRNTTEQGRIDTHRHGCVLNDDILPLRSCEKKKVDFINKLYLAPLTTCGNLPFRVICKRMGADLTCGEMALSTNLLQGQTSEWALIKRHPCEETFGVQLCGAFPDTMTRCAEMLNRTCEIDFIDINMGCPIDLVYKKGAGSALMRRTNKLFDIVNCMNRVIDVPLTCKLRTGIENNKNCAHSILPLMRDAGVALATIHGRSREARYTKIANWNYIAECAKAASPMPLFGNGDIYTYHDYYSVMENTPISGVMIARGALIKPWIFTEIKERRDWDISSSERFVMLKDFVNEGLMHWGSDSRGIEITRRFLLEWCSFLHRYIPVGLLERPPQRINERPPYYRGRDDLETLMASPNSNDWIKLSELLLGKVPDSFNFLPKHKANAYK